MINCYEPIGINYRFNSPFTLIIINEPLIMKNIYLTILFLTSFYAVSLAQTECTDDQISVTIKITTDGYGSETSWDVKDNDTNVTYYAVNGGTYPSQLPDTTYIYEFCIPQDACATFTINDSYGDGMCCEHGDGGYEVIVDDVLIASGGDFGSQETVVFNCDPGVVCGTAIPVTEGSYTTANADYWYVFTPDEPGTYLSLIHI